MKKIPMLERFAAQSLVEYEGELIFSKEKFAELIVREMLDIFDKRAEPGTGFYEPQEPAEMIREHFGVEE